MVHTISFKIQWLILTIYFLGKKKKLSLACFCFFKKAPKIISSSNEFCFSQAKCLELGVSSFELYACIGTLLILLFFFFFLITTLLLLIKLGGIEDLKLLLQLIKKGKKKKNFLCYVFAWLAYEWLSKK